MREQVLRFHNRQISYDLVSEHRETFPAPLVGVTACPCSCSTRTIRAPVLPFPPTNAPLQGFLAYRALRSVEPVMHALLDRTQYLAAFVPSHRTAL